MNAQQLMLSDASYIQNLVNITRVETWALNLLWTVADYTLSNTSNKKMIHKWAPAAKD